MKHSSCLPLFLAALACVSHADGRQVWTVDKTSNTGYVSLDYCPYDADKNPAFDDGDDLMCWAASASNMISWWQNQNPEAAAAAGAPTRLEDIWSVYKETFADEGADRSCGIDWWFFGRDGWNDTGLPAYKDGATNQGAYYQDYLKDQLDIWGFRFDDGSFSQSTVNACGSFAGAKSFSFTVMDLLTTGHAVGLNIEALTMGGDGSYNVVPGSGHALTLWGIEYDDTENAITKMWVTDSDDTSSVWGLYEHDMFEIDLTELTITETNGSETNTCTFESELLLPAKYSPRRLYANYSYAITGYTYLSADNVGYFTFPNVPEPATSTLSALALASICMRRRRK